MADLHDEEHDILILNKAEYSFLMRNIKHLYLDTQKILFDTESDSDEYFEVSSSLELLEMMEEAVFELKNSNCTSAEEERICDSILESFCAIFGPLEEDQDELDNELKDAAAMSKVLNKPKIIT